MNTEETLTLQNEFLQIRILPAFGGKISSLRSARTGEKFQLPPLRGYRHVSRTACFHEGDLGGFDECLPSVASCESTSDEPPVPDHGDLWRSKWHINSDDRPITIHADSLSRPLRLTRHSWLDGPSLVLDYDLLNLSDSPTTWLWSAHPLLRIEAGDRILLPDEIKDVVVEYSAAWGSLRKEQCHWLAAGPIGIGNSDRSEHCGEERWGDSAQVICPRGQIRVGRPLPQEDRPRADSAL